MDWDLSMNAIWDHPHAYGDKIAYMRHAWSVMGSSPRVWGQDTFVDILTAGDGIIPTRMGTSIAAASIAGDVEDHPHAYGDK